MLCEQRACAAWSLRMSNKLLQIAMRHADRQADSSDGEQLTRDFDTA